jgi:hypothetical protein
MTNKPHMTEKQLFKALRKQGLGVTVEGEQVTVFAPGPVSSMEEIENTPFHKFHRSSLEHGAYWAVLRDLEKIGFRDPQELHREELERRRQERASRVYKCEGEAATRFGVTCGCGREFKAAMNLARHLSALAEREGKKEKTGKAAEREWKTEHAPEITKPKPKEEVRQIRMLVRRLHEFSAQAEQLAQMFEPLLEENEELKRKLRKVEDLFGKVLDEL